MKMEESGDTNLILTVNRDKKEKRMSRVDKMSPLMINFHSCQNRNDCRVLIVLH